ncbi:MAG: anti-sigma factor antagonist [Clostridiales bacterium]|nr:anti-sigma factor antagonist [Clostridiales bacterium]
MDITVSGKEHLITVRPSGELDHHAAKLIRTKIDDEILRTGAVNLAFDLSRVTFMDSSGVGVIIGRYRKITALGGRVFLYGMNENVEKLCRMSGLDKLTVMVGADACGKEVF